MFKNGPYSEDRMCTGSGPRGQTLSNQDPGRPHKCLAVGQVFPMDQCHVFLSLGERKAQRNKNYMGDVFFGG